jgi:cation diffusion facilitator family transporter
MRKKESERPVVILAAMGANLGIAVAKFVAAALTGSSAMISEGIHSLVDTANEGLLLIGLDRSQRSPDAEHPFGYGKELYFWSFIVAIVIFGAGGGVALYEGITHILDPTELEDPFISYIVLGIAFVLEGGSWVIAYRAVSSATAPGTSKITAIRNSKDPSVVTVLLEDSAALAGLLVAGTGIFISHQLGDPRIDGLASVVIGTILAGVAVFLAAEARGLLVGERADPELIGRLREVTEADEEVDAVEDIRSMHMGPDHVVVTLRVRFIDPESDHVARTIERIEGRLRAEDERLSDVTMQPVSRRHEPPSD